ncbi:hypothetical protein [Antrihabitans sp. YC2-6]|uniref:hypothetical protein n=1 Tax=Antrihabitans sp. YC2-6 TaxID=2799498 RepID=UPI0018F4215C|nr:hypothetical protein [Antrihabitans sp. YC2-6]MBJ8343222.1 hypothetical protein [Antrihabitans sp. YC2-6]
MGNTAYDVASGDLLWTAPIPEFFLPLLFDGERVIGFTPEGYIAINTHTGERDWETGPLDGAGGLGPAGAGLAAISPTELVFFRPGR